MIDYPLKSLSVEKFCLQAINKNVKYDLFAVNCHRGNPDFGHYYCYASNDLEKWVIYNDEQY